MFFVTFHCAFIVLCVAVAIKCFINLSIYCIVLKYRHFIPRYTLHEMSVTWNMYGGNDFRSGNDPAPAKKTVTIEDRKLSSPTSVK